jgi:TRAP-type C4-dicarboxylate transport system permease small subunit
MGFMRDFFYTYQAFLDRLEKGAIWTTSFLLALLLGNEALGIGCDLFGHSIPWITEVSVCLFAWVVFLGAGILSRRGGHISLDFLVERLPSSLQIWLRVGYSLITLVVVVVLVYWGGQLALFVGRFQKSVYLQISLFYFYSSVPVGGILIGLNSLGAIFPNPKREEMTKLGRIEENPLY